MALVSDPSQVHQILYISYASEEFLDPNLIIKMLAKARKYNASKGITGVLLYKGGVFVQLLEGERGALEELYKKIAVDPRHLRMIKVCAQDTDQRIFPEWSMAYREVSEPDLKMMNEVLSWTNLISGNAPIERSTIKKMLESFHAVLEAA